MKRYGDNWSHWGVLPEKCWHHITLFQYRYKIGQNVQLYLKQKCGARHQMHVAEAPYEHMASLLSNLLLIVSTFSTGIFRYIFGSFSNK